MELYLFGLLSLLRGWGEVRRWGFPFVRSFVRPFVRSSSSPQQNVEIVTDHVSVLLSACGDCY